MQDKLLEAYNKRLKKLFSDTNKHVASKQVGAEKAIIKNTIPFMILEIWREDGHENVIPLLDETVKNVILAVTTTFFGWEKTINLHLRVALENILYGINIAKKPTALSAFYDTGILRYRKFSTLTNEFVRSSSMAKQIENEFVISNELSDLYSSLSSWSHSLGNEYFANLQILGRNKLSNIKIGRIKKSFRLLSRQATIVYLTVFPNILNDLQMSNQKLLLSILSVPERKKLREIIQS